ncbi:MAG: type II secretion system F family protein [Eubacteriales bacterium]|nr:type II secretion system F family protein [Eubacteriales bacterium]
MLIGILAGSFLSIFLFIIVIFSGKDDSSDSSINKRLNKISKKNSTEEGDELVQPFFTRVLRPVLDEISKRVMKAAPKEIISGYEKRITMAGNPFNLGVKGWINLHIVFVVAFPIITAVLIFYLGGSLKSIVSFAILEITFGFMIPNIFLGMKIKDRIKNITNSMPDVLDLLTVSVEAGLGFDSALMKVVEKMPGALAEEFKLVLKEMKLGKQRREALRDMADKVNVADLSAFISSIIQAEQLGVSIGNVLRIQSSQMRMNRRQRASEKAMKAPVKMILPMVFFIFPTIFAVLLGPVVINIMDTLLK